MTAAHLAQELAQELAIPVDRVQAALDNLARKRLATTRLAEAVKLNQRVNRAMRWLDTPSC